MLFKNRNSEFQIYKYTITGKLSLLPMNPSGNECLAAFGVSNGVHCYNVYLLVALFFKRWDI